MGDERRRLFVGESVRVVLEAGNLEAAHSCIALDLRKGTAVLDSPMGKREVLTRARIGDLWCVGRKNGRIVGIRRKPAGSFERIVIDPSGVTVDGPVLDGSGATDPTGVWPLS